MARHEQLYAGPDGWSRWLWPIMQGYRLTCCDCGLVHDIEVMVHKATGGANALKFRAENRPARGYRIRWRFRTNKRATAAVRRYIKKTKQA